MSDFKAGNDMFTYQGTPEPDSGTRIVPPDELQRMVAARPGMRKAFDLVEKASFSGKPSAVKMTTYHQLNHNREIDLQVKQQKQIIDFAKRKKEGKIL